MVVSQLVLSENNSCCCRVGLLRRTGHLHDGGAEEVLQRHEEAGLQETSEAHPPTSGTSAQHAAIYTTKRRSL